MTSAQPMVLNDRVIKEDKYGFVSLTDIWISAGRPASLTPARWSRIPDRSD